MGASPGTCAAVDAGLTLSQGARDRAEVTSVVPNSEAQRAGVQPGDLVVGLEGNEVGSYADFMAVVRSLGRPLRVTFQRQQSAPSSGGRGSAAGAGGSAADAEERRRAALKAAEARGQAWERRLNTTRSSKAQQAKQNRQLRSSASGEDNSGGATEENGVGGEPFAESTAGREAFDEAKRREASEAASLGFNPYQPIFGSSTQGRAAISQAEQEAAGPSSPHVPHAPLASPGLGAPSGAGMSGSTNGRSGTGGGGGAARRAGGLSQRAAGSAEAAAALRALADQPPEISNAAAGVITKLLSNLIDNFNDPKYHRVRLANKTFNAKVGSVEGGIETMIAAGFILTSDGDDGEPTLVFPEGGRPPEALRQVLAEVRKLIL